MCSSDGTPSGYQNSAGDWREGRSPAAGAACGIAPGNRSEREIEDAGTSSIG